MSSSYLGISESRNCIPSRSGVIDSTARCATWRMVAPGVSYTPRDLIPTDRFSTRSTRPNAGLPPGRVRCARGVAGPSFGAEVHQIPAARVRFPRRHRGRDAVLLRIMHQVGPSPEFPLPPRGDDTDAGHQRVVGELEPHLVVPLPRRTLRHGVRLLLARHLDLLFRDEGPRDGGAEEIRPLVHRVRHEGGEDEIPDELVLDVFHVYLRGPRLLRLGAHELELLSLTEVRHEGDHFGAARLQQPLPDERGVAPPP